MNKKVIVIIDGKQKLGFIEKYDEATKTYQVNVKIKDEGEEVEFDTLKFNEDEILHDET